MEVIATKFAQLRDRLESAAFLVSKGGSDKQVHSELVQAIIALAEIERGYMTTSVEAVEPERYEDEVSKVRNRLRLWARPDRQGQINSRILNAFLRLQKSMQVVTEADIRNELPDIESFDSNFAQMKIIAEKNHGKIFDQTGSVVSIWEPVLSFVREYERSRDTELKRESHEIISVEIVDGHTLKSHWSSPMQVVVTNRGKFIDNVPGVNGGFDWKPKIGQIVDGIKIASSAGFKWLNKQ